MPGLTIHDNFLLILGAKLVNLDTDTIKLVLLDVEPDPTTDTVLADLTQIAGVHGYVTGGLTITGTGYALDAGSGILSGDNLTINPAGGNIGPWRYIALIDSTVAGEPIIASGDAGVELTLPNGVPFVIGGAPANVWLTVSKV